MRTMYLDMLKKVTISDEFWGNKLRQVISETLPQQWNALNDRLPGIAKSGAIENFRMAAGESEKGAPTGFIFQDSDLYKWLESVAYSLIVQPDAELERTADEMIGLIGKAQWEDGYINTHYTLRAPEKRFSNLRDDHELYCAGHMFEAAAAYHYATGKRDFTDIAIRFADLIDSRFGAEDGKQQGYPGHEEIELALVKLSHITGSEKYMKLAKYFIDERGKEPNYFEEEAKARENDNGQQRWMAPLTYFQAHLPVREQDAAVGHSVRAMYLYCAMTDIAAHYGDESLKSTLHKLWRNVTQTQMYITGGIGSQSDGEAFSFSYDLPNDETYSETCAQIGLFLWAYRMFTMEFRAEYADIMERVLYNGIICGVSLDGKKYFYTNPLEIVPQLAKNRRDKRQSAERQAWFDCACCPPNLARLMLSLPAFIYTVKDNTAFVNLYIGSETTLDIRDQEVRIKQESSCSRDGRVTFTVRDAPKDFKLKLRIPYWADDVPAVTADDLDVGVNDGYITLSGDWDDSHTVSVTIAVRAKFVSAKPKVIENAGKVALTRGPFVYCFEQADNGADLAALSVSPSGGVSEVFEPELLGGVISLTCHGFRDTADYGALYSEYSPRREPVTLKAVPYFAWNNRGEGEMRVWMRVT